MLLVLTRANLYKELKLKSLHIIAMDHERKLVEKLEDIGFASQKKIHNTYVQVNGN